MKNIFILTGAGISAESGVPTFRDEDGLWERFPIEEVASIGGYERNPARVLDFYNARRRGLVGVKPNAAHLALAQLEACWPGQFTLCTQNIDDLHELAGSKAVLHMHGELAKARCHDCGDVSIADGDLTLSLGCAACGRIGGLRPHVVWFGEAPLMLDEIYAALASADVFVAIGTSGAVYPAAGFVSAAAASGISTVEINLAPSDNAEVFEVGRYGKASIETPAWVAEMIGLLRS